MIHKALIVRVLRRAGWLLLALLAWCGYVMCRIINMASTDEVMPSDAIIVLGAATHHDAPSPALAGRLRYAIELYRRGAASKLILTGGLHHDGTRAESEVSRQVAIDAGVPPSDILIETSSQTTYGNLCEVKRIMDEHALRSAILVSDPLHLFRARTMSDDLGLVAHPSPTPYSAFRTIQTKVPFLICELYYWHTYTVRRSLGIHIRN